MRGDAVRRTGHCDCQPDTQGTFRAMTDHLGAGRRDCERRLNRDVIDAIGIGVYVALAGAVCFEVSK